MIKNRFIRSLVLFICMDSSLFRDFLLMAYDLNMINGEYVFVYLDIFRLLRFVVESNRIDIRIICVCFSSSEKI